jgi:hypothetical protein
MSASPRLLIVILIPLLAGVWHNRHDVIHAHVVQTGSVKPGLASGAFPPIKDAQLGAPIKFENEIDIAECFPIIVSDVVVGWIANAHAAEGELLISRCVEYDPSIKQTPGNRHGGTLEKWERVRMSADRRALVGTPLPATEWSFLSNPRFCGKLVAYWGLQENGRLTARILDVLSGKEIASLPVGTARPESDAKGIFARPQWDKDCSKASFTAEPFLRGTWTLP